MTAPATTELAAGIGELVVTDDPEAVIVARGLGSCVAVLAYCPRPRVGGVLHVMLPSSEGRASEGLDARYADTGVEALLAQMRDKGAYPQRLVVKIAGGAAVLRVAKSKAFQVGERNAAAVEAELERRSVPIAARALGGTRGRTVALEIGSGRVLVRVLGGEPQEL